MVRLAEISKEFARQAKQMAASAAFRESRSLGEIERFASLRGTQRVLDLACGLGYVAERLSPLAAHVVALDVTPEMLRRVPSAREIESGRIDPLQGDAARLPFADAAFDVVVTRLLLHHMPEPASVFREVKRVLVPGGCFISADLAAGENRPDARLHDELERTRDPTHVRLLTPRELESLLVDAGFGVELREEWSLSRDFEEWAAVVDDRGRTDALWVRMRRLAAAGADLGISLRLGPASQHGVDQVGERILFSHRWFAIRVTKL